MMKTLAQNTKEVGSSAYWGENGDWLIVDAITRDSGCLTRSNFRCILKDLKALPEVKEWSGEFVPVTIERFNHWACGWIDYLVVNPECKAAVALAESIHSKLENYPVYDDEDFSNLETEEAETVWRYCYNAKERAAYVRQNRGQFDFANLSDMIGCIRGRYFAGYASELLS